MKHLVWDLETNGFLREATKIHCLVLRDMESDEVLSCTDADPRYPSIDEGLAVLAAAEKAYGHNIIGYDLPVLRKLRPEWSYEGKMVDTLPILRTRWAHIKESDYDRARKGRLPGALIGHHSLKAWGYRLGILKGDFSETTDWAEWTEEMQDYCEQDTLVNKQMVVAIREKGRLPPRVVHCELELNRFLTQLERNGWPFDFEAAIRLQADLAAERQALADDLVDHFGQWCEPKEANKKLWRQVDTPDRLQWSAHKGYAFVPKRDNSRYGYVEDVPCVKLKWKTFNPASRQHIADRMMEDHGWEPESFTPTGQPQVGESDLAKIDHPVSQKLIDYLTIDKRLGALAEGKQAWLGHMEDDQPEGGAITGLPHIHHRITPTTVTHRHRHSGPNMSQVPSNDKPYGERCRSLFIAPSGWKIVGTDADGLELRCLAHYMYPWDDGEYADAVLNGDKAEGTDVHSLNAKALGLPRSDAKTFIYAYLYGAGDKKLGSIVEPTASDRKLLRTGKDLRAEFESRIPALGTLTERVKAYAKRDGYLRLIDGRLAYVRSPHSALNTLLQGTGSVACKWWAVFTQEKLLAQIGPNGWDSDWAALGWFHDEFQTAAREGIAPTVADLWTSTLPEVGDFLDFNLPLTADFAIGDTWAETH